MTHQELLQQFLARFPASSLPSMTIEQYTQAGSKDTFCYWLEFALESLGNVSGSTAFKFGIFNRKDLKDMKNSDGVMYDGPYGWQRRFGDNYKDAFLKVRSNIVQIVQTVQAGKTAEIDDILLSPQIKWKIAYLYQDQNNPKIVAIYSQEALRRLAFGEEAKRQPLSMCYAKLIAEKNPGSDLFDFSTEKWRQWEAIQSDLQVVGLIASDPADWVEDMRLGMADGKKGVAWWSKMPSGGADVLAQLRSRIGDNDEDAKGIDLYLSRGDQIRWKLSISDIATKDTYDPAKWQGAHSYEPDFAAYVDGNKRAAIAFLVDKVEDLGSTLNMTQVRFYKGHKRPTQDNLQPISQVMFTPPEPGGRGGGVAEPPPGIYSVKAPNSPRNIILYGPPGTGKTYETRKLALDLIGESIPSDRTVLVDRYKELVDANQIAFTTFHQSLAYEEFVEGIRPRNTGSGISYEERPGIFVEFCREAHRNWISSMQNTKALDFDALWKDFCDEVETNGNVIVKTSQAQYKVYEIDEDSIHFERQNGKRTHTLNASTLESYFDGVQTKTNGMTAYYMGLVNLLKTRRANAIPQKSDPLKQYVLIIDEINRANISKVFGELITLVEPSKRLGQSEELSAILPYSGIRFGVPPNVHIIGTMNTADRSIALMDTALRRRFEFRELMPRPELIPGSNGQGYIPVGDGQMIQLQDMLRAMNERIRLLLHRDSTLGHAYFMDVRTFDELKSVMLRHVVPLLQEFFYSDWRRIQLVLADIGANDTPSPHQIIKSNLLDESKVLGFDDKDARSRIDYTVVDESNLVPESIIKIYQGAAPGA